MLASRRPWTVLERLNRLLRCSCFELVSLGESMVLLSRSKVLVSKTVDLRCETMDLPSKTMDLLCEIKKIR